MRWEQQWDVPGSGGRTYKVSRDYNGNYGCSCPQWIYKRDDCKHIKAVRIFQSMSNIGLGRAASKCMPTTDMIGQISRKFKFE